MLALLFNKVGLLICKTFLFYRILKQNNVIYMFNKVVYVLGIFFSGPVLYFYSVKKPEYIFFDLIHTLSTTYTLCNLQWKQGCKKNQNFLWELPVLLEFVAKRCLFLFISPNKKTKKKHTSLLLNIFIVNFSFQKYSITVYMILIKNIKLVLFINYITK